MDLLFPSFHINDLNWVAGASAKVNTSAAKLFPTCRCLSESVYRIFNETFIYHRRPYDNYTSLPGERWSIGLIQDFDCPDENQGNVSLPLWLNKAVNAGGAPLYVGDSIASPLNPRVTSNACGDSSTEGALSDTSHAWLVETYAWGRFSPSLLDFESLSICECNYTWVDVMTEVNLLWSEGENNQP